MGAHFWPPDPPCDNPVVCLACCKRRERDAVVADRARIAQAIRDERSRFGLEDEAFDTLDRLLRVVEGG